MQSMRDAFFYRVFEYAKNNADIVVLTPDFSTPSFDRFRTELPGQFLNTGISEQNTLLVAAGLAHSGKNVFIAGIAPFVAMRCFEQTRLYAADMNMSIKIVAVGAGFSYNTAGPTHHSVEDIAIMRALPNMRIFSPSCNSQVEEITAWSAENLCPAYIRLDRAVLDELYDNKFAIDGKGFRVLRESGDIMLASTGYMTHTALRAADALREKGVDAGVIDIYSLPAAEDELLDALRRAKRIITIEEHVYPGGVGSYICELLADNGFMLPIKRIALDFSKGLYHGYGTRDEMHEACGISVKHILSFIERSGVNAR